MADSLRIVRKLPAVQLHRTTRARALVAASQPVDNPGRAFKKSMSGAGRREDWQERAWEAYDTCGELRFYTGWRSSSASRVRLIASAIDPDTGIPTGGIDPDDAQGKQVAEVVRSIAGGPQGQAQLLRRVTECLTVPGEIWVTILYLDGPMNPPTWLPVVPDEVTASERKTIIELPTGDKHEYGGKDGMFRVWNPRARRAKEADSPVRAAMDSLDEIRRTTKTIANASKSRLIGNGIVFVPSEMSLPSMNMPIASSRPGDPLPPIVGTPAVQQLQELLFQVAQTAYDDEDSMAALIPMFASANGDMIKNVHHLKFDNEVTEVAIKTRNDAIQRLAMGLDVSPERLLGIGSQSNHWSAWQIGDDDVRLHILPPVELLCQAITDQVLRKVLVRMNIDPNKYVVWHDASQLTVDPDMTDEAKFAFEQGAITAEAMVKMLNLPDDTVHDFTTPDGWATWARDAAGRFPEKIATFAPLIPELANIEFPEAQQAIEQGKDDDEDDSGASREEEPDTEDDDDDSDTGQQAALNDREVVFAEASLFRALEVAGKRRRNRSNHERLRSVPVRETHRHLDPVRSEQVSELIAGWDSILEDPSVRALNLNVHAIRRWVRKQAEAELTCTIDGDVS